MSYSKKLFSLVLAVLTVLNTTIPVSAQNNLLSFGGNAAEQIVLEDGNNVGYDSEETVIDENAVSVDSSETTVSDTDSGMTESTDVSADLSGVTEATDEATAEVPADVTESSDESVPADDSSVAADASQSLLPEDSSVSELVEESVPLDEELVGAAVSDGLYYVYTNQPTPYMMCVKGNSADENVNIQLGTFTSSNVRIFYIENTGSGYYYIHNFHTYKYLTLGTNNNVQQNSISSKGEGQKWFLSKKSDGSFQFLTADKKQKLTAVSNKSGANICVSDKETGVQSWRLKSTKPLISGGMVKYIYEKSVEKAEDGTVTPPTVTIDLYGTILTENVDYTVSTTIGTDSGTITLKGIGDYLGTKKLTYTIFTYPLPEGYYHIYTNSSTLKPMFSIKGNTSANMGNAQLGSFVGSNVRLFVLEHAGDGYYYIRNYHTGKYLTAEGDENNSNVSQYSLKNTADQQWRLAFVGHTYRIISRSSGKYLIAPKAKVGANLQLYGKRAYKYAWTILPAKRYIGGGKVSYDYKDCVLYDPDTGDYEKPEVNINLYGTDLQEGVDFTASYKVYPSKGIGQITLTGIGEFRGSKLLTFSLYVLDEEPYPELPVDVDTYQSDYRFDWVFKLGNTSTKLYLTREGYHGSLTNISSCVMCDMAARKLYIMKGYKTFAMDSMRTLTSGSFSSITPKVGEIYTLSLERSDTFATTFTLMENSTGKSESISSYSYHAGRGWGKTYTYVNGVTYDIYLKGYSTKPGDGILAVMGDSYTEGATLRNGYSGRYATLLDNKYGKTVMITGRGSATSALGLKWLQGYLGEIAKPKYMIIEFGMNDSSYSTWLNNMSAMIAILEANGTTPILATIPPVTTKSDEVNATHREMSKWIRKSGYMYLDFEYLMTANHDRVTIDSSKFLADNVHPTAEVHQSVVDLFLKEYGNRLSA